MLQRTFADFISDEGHATDFNWRTALKGRWAKWAVALIILNEIRGAVVAGSIAWQMWGQPLSD